MTEINIGDDYKNIHRFYRFQVKLCKVTSRQDLGPYIEQKIFLNNVEHHTVFLHLFFCDFLDIVAYSVFNMHILTDSNT